MRLPKFPPGYSEWLAGRNYEFDVRVFDKWDCTPGAINILPDGCRVEYIPPSNGLRHCLYCGGYVTPTKMSGNCPNCAGRLD